MLSICTGSKAKRCCRMMADKTSAVALEVDLTFLKSKRGLLKIAEMVSLFVAFVCFAVASSSPYLVATSMELSITLALLLLYLLKLNKKLTAFFWPLIDVFNSFFAAAFMSTVSLVAVSMYTQKGTLAGGIVGLVTSALCCLDGFYLFKKITFNLPTAACRVETCDT
ncbi:chemokine-like factor [Electrophorus electricus]|uniref:chemokine-like factor n=1 Tax=Electrophorus electricus TaxID=8005 RepID=UPI0015CFDC7C|nr:chemokine-like factor [Electrophorus electricus]